MSAPNIIRPGGDEEIQMRRQTVRDTLTFTRAGLELLRNVTAWLKHNGYPHATKGQVVEWALELLAAKLVGEHDIDAIPPRGEDYDLRYGPRG